MTPADILAAARLSPLSPVVPAREEWLKGWIGPSQPDQCPEAMAIRDGAIVDDSWVGLPSGIWLDLRRPEVRDRMMRCGAPEWCRDSVAGMLGWALGGDPEDEHWSPMRDHETEAAVRARCIVPSGDGWYIPLPGGSVGWLPKESA